MDNFGKIMLKFAVLSLCYTSCAGQLIRACSNRLDGEEIVTLGAGGDHITFSLYTPRRDAPALSCRNGENTLSFRQNEMQLISTNTRKDGHLLSQELNDVPNRYFTKNGMFGLREGNVTHYYYPEEFCITFKEGNKFRNAWHRGIMGIRICKANCRGKAPCIQKCCPMEEAFDLQSGGCAPTKLAWSPFLYSHESSVNFTRKSKFRPHYIHNVLRCPGSLPENQNIDAWYGYGLDVIPDEIDAKRIKFKLLEDGSIVAITSRSRKWDKLSSKQFCIDVIQNFSSTRTAAASEKEQIVFVCNDTQSNEIPVTGSVIYSGVMYFASIFLLLTCLYYILLWDEQNIHGWTTFSFVLSMFFMFVFMGTSNLLAYMSARSDSTFRESPLCVIIGILAHFSFLSTFTWLSFVNIDLYLDFGSLSVVAKKSGELTRYCAYATLSWGIPIIVVTTGIILNYKYPDDESLVPVPDYGREVCFITPSAQGVYLYYIVSFLIGVNLIFTTATFYNLYKAKKDTLYTRSNKTDYQKCQTNTFVITIKLFVVMGVTWIFEIISYWMQTKEGSNQAWYWYVSDFLNLFQAILIFRIFVCKRTTIDRLQQKYPSCKKIFMSSKGKNSEKDPFVRIYKPIT